MLAESDRGATLDLRLWNPDFRRTLASHWANPASAGLIVGDPGTSCAATLKLIRLLRRTTPGSDSGAVADTVVTAR